ncbi:unnamed protein product, partial [Heterotrigona itama]
MEERPDHGWKRKKKKERKTPKNPDHLPAKSSARP